MANRLPKELWMAIIGDDFRVYDRLVRSIPGLYSLISGLIQDLRSKHTGTVNITSGYTIYVVPALAGRIHTIRPFETGDFGVYARHGRLALNEGSPSLYQTTRDDHGGPTAKLIVYAQFGRLSRHDGPAFKFLDYGYGLEIYAVDGNVSRIKCILLWRPHETMYDVHMESATATAINSRKKAASCVTNNEFDYEKFARRSSQTMNVNIPQQNINSIMHHASMLACVPISYSHLSEIYNLVHTR